MTFLWPTALVALVCLPLLAGVYVWMQRRRKAYAVRFTNLSLLREVVGTGPGLRRHVPPVLFLLGMAALLVSLARPTMVLAVPRTGSNVMLVLDVSGSMAATDIQPTRLGAATAAATQFIDSLPDGTRVGVVSFSQGASVVAPLSSDKTRAETALQRLTPDGGTAIGDGLDAALTQLSQAPVDSQGEHDPGLVVLLSDGENNFGQAPATVAQRATQQGVQVDTVGIGQRGQEAYVDRQPVGLDETTLRNIASVTGGQYFYAADAGQLSQIYSQLSSHLTWVPQRTEITALVSGLAAAFFLVAAGLSMRWFGRLP
ncbi:MAG: VWA domain-containing protein [Chloroflexi bacterium]|nr:VWA domain-containing protein [Chloroflexota bacterium]